MMKRLNEIRIIGRVTQAGEIKPTANNLLYKFSIAVDGKKTSFFNVIAWDKTATSCSKLLSKGKAVYIEGYLKQNTWKDKETGANRSIVGIVANYVELVESDNKDKKSCKTETLS